MRLSSLTTYSLSTTTQSQLSARSSLTKADLLWFYRFSTVCSVSVHWCRFSSLCGFQSFLWKFCETQFSLANLDPNGSQSERSITIMFPFCTVSHSSWLLRWCTECWFWFHCFLMFPSTSWVCWSVGQGKVPQPKWGNTVWFPTEWSPTL
jgi:hypothetical protein